MEMLALRTSLPQGMQFLLVTGFLGGFSTFSAFSLDLSLMLERGDYAACGLYVGASVLPAPSFSCSSGPRQSGQCFSRCSQATVTRRNRQTCFHARNALAPSLIGRGAAPR